MSLDHPPNWVIPPTLIIVQPGENKSALGNAYPQLLNLDHSPNGNHCPAPTSYNKPFCETTHNCELRKNDCPKRRTILLDHYSE
jgi:hypothetical protein